MGSNIKDGPVKPSICWLCQHCIPRKGNPCSWAMHFQPVEGWEAKQTWLRLSETKLQTKVPSYKVINCPLFKRG